ncbi:60S ribosomal protein L36A [Conglomerata obtusa]
MVNVPKRKRTHCVKCVSHTEHKVSQYKKCKDGKLKQGARRYARKQRGYNGQTKPILKRKCKVTKKLVLKLECSVCKRKVMKGMKRTKHCELGAGKKVKGEALVY